MTASSGPGKRKRSPEQEGPRIHIGTAGFGTRSWCGPIYPPGTKQDGLLTAYQARFGWVEINSTAYRMPSADQIHQWKAQCAKGFVVTLKLPMSITHEHKLGPSCHHDLARFAEAARGLGEHLGPVLIQLPRTVPAQAELLRAAWSWLEGLQVAFEPRHPSWFEDDESLAALREFGWALVNHPNSVGRATVGSQAGGRDGMSGHYRLEPFRELESSSWVYCRLHGDNDEHTYNYTPQELTPYAERLCKWWQQGKTVYVAIISGDEHAAMAKNALELSRQVHGLVGVPKPKAPRQLQSIASFFVKPKAQKKPSDD